MLSKPSSNDYSVKLARSSNGMRAREAYLTRSLLLAVMLAASIGGLARCAPVHSQGQEVDDVGKRLSFVRAVYMEPGKYHEAVEMLSKLAKQNPNNVDVRINLGFAKIGEKDYAGAEEEFKRALKLEPRNAEAHYYLGVVYYASGDNQAALDEYRRALDDPVYANKTRVYLGLVDVYDDIGQSDEAIRHARMAIESNPKDSAAHLKLAVLLDRLDRTKEAIEEYEIAAPGFASDPNYHYRLGVAYFRDGKPDLARQHLTMVTVAVPGTEKARKAKEFLELISAGAPPRSG